MKKSFKTSRSADGLSNARLTFILMILLLLALPPRLPADAIVTVRAMTASTIAEFFITEEGIRVELEIGVQSLEAFRNLMPDEIYERMGHEPQPFADRLKQFLKDDWIIRNEKEIPLQGFLREMESRKRIVRDEITGEPLPMPEDERETVIFAVIEFPFVERPVNLTFTPPGVANPLSMATDIGFMVYHDGLPVMDFRYLGQPCTLDLDWEDPWFSRFRNRNLVRQYSSPITGFLYVDPFEVRKEIICRPFDLQHWIDLGLEGKTIIPAADQAAMKEKIAAFLMEKNPVLIDGRVIEPKLDRIHFVRRSLKTTGVIDPPEDLPVISATLGVIFVYPIKALPQEATMTWELFTPRLNSIPTVATDEAGGLPWTVTPDDPVLKWQNFLKNPTIPGLVDVAPPEPAKLVIPILSAASIVALIVLLIRFAKMTGPRPRAGYVLGLVLVIAAVLLWPYLPVALPNPLGGIAAMEEEKSRDIMSGLLKNVYHAFDYRDEGLIYDTLARSASGDLLTQIYLETRQALELENQGGARAKVKEVAVLDSLTTALADEAGFQSRLTWTVGGSVGHWGHIHMRRNQYEALFKVMPMEGRWKIQELELLSEERL